MKFSEMTKRQKIFAGSATIFFALVILGIGIYFTFIKKDTPKPTPKPKPRPKLTPYPIDKLLDKPNPTDETTSKPTDKPTISLSECSPTKWMCGGNGLKSCKCKAGQVCNGFKCVTSIPMCENPNSYCMMGAENTCKCKAGEVCDGVKCIKGTTPIWCDGMKCSECFDSNPSCEEWAAKGECDANPTWMLTNCKKSCSTCDKYKSLTAFDN